MSMSGRELGLVLWDIDRTLLYVGDVDRQVYRESFAALVGREAVQLPARGTGVTMPLAVRSLLLDNGVPEQEVPALQERIVAMLPECLAAHVQDIKERGVLMAGAKDALKAVHAHPQLVPSVVTGNLQGNALIKLRTFNLEDYVTPAIGGYASDDSHRPTLVSVAQQRAAHAFGVGFTHANTVIIGDSLEDIRTGKLGGAAVIAVASGKTAAQDLAVAGADVVLDSLQDVPRLMKAIAALMPFSLQE